MITIAGGILLAVTVLVLFCVYPEVFGRALFYGVAISALGGAGFVVVAIARAVTT